MAGRKKPGKEEASIVRSSAAEYLTFVASGGGSEASIEMRYENENIWLTQKMMSALYDVSVLAINQHLKRIFADNKLTREATVKKHLIVQTEGNRQVRREVEHYCLQAIIAVGFKMENERAVQFRKWANQIVKDHTIQGWTMDVERLKHGRPRKPGYSVFVDGALCPYRDQWSLLASVRRMSVVDVVALAEQAQVKGRITGVRLPITDDIKGWKYVSLHPQKREVRICNHSRIPPVIRKYQQKGRSVKLRVIRNDTLLKVYIDDKHVVDAPHEASTKETGLGGFYVASGSENTV